jgi:hypothetical protein
MGVVAGWIWFNKWTCESGRPKKKTPSSFSQKKRKKNFKRKAKSTYFTPLGLPKEIFPHH